MEETKLTQLIKDCQHNENKFLVLWQYENGEFQAVGGTWDKDGRKGFWGDFRSKCYSTPEDAIKDLTNRIKGAEST
jgi:hypothetical protein